MTSHDIAPVLLYTRITLQWNLHLQTESKPKKYTKLVRRQALEANICRLRTCCILLVSQGSGYFSLSLLSLHLTTVFKSSVVVRVGS